MRFDVIGVKRVVDGVEVGVGDASDLLGVDCHAGGSSFQTVFGADMALIMAA